MNDDHRKRPVAGTGLFFAFLFFLLCSTLLLPSVTSWAGSFDVQPVRVFFTKRTRVEKLVIRNLSASDLTVQIKAFTWVQDNDGKDVYEDTPDILVFPRILKIPKEGQRLIRLGTTVGPAIREGTYRVYVEELLVGDKKAKGAGVRFVLKVGVPLFVSPLVSDNKGATGSFTMEGGKARLRTENTGNTHLVVQSITVTGRDDRGEETFSKNLNGWYLLGGVSRTYTTQIPPTICRRLSTVQAIVRTTKNSFEETMQVTGGMCGLQTR